VEQLTPDPANTAPGASATTPGTLRQRRTRELRAQLSDTATRLFLEQGFDKVRVADVARACEVTEKTVFNHFPTKEALLLDRWEHLITAVGIGLADRRVTAVAAVVGVVDRELDELTVNGAATTTQMQSILRFGQLIVSTPSRLAYRRHELQRLGDAILTALAKRGTTTTADPEGQVIAEALTGLVTVFYRSLARNATSLDASACRKQVRRDTRTAANRLTAGISD
jgi:AcrR family transcriptional regulator